MSNGKLVWWSLALATLVAWHPALVGESRAADQPATPAAAATGEVAKLIKQLDADQFTERQAASDKLQAMGKAVIEALVGAATGESLEATVRAIEILKKFHDAGDAATKEAAKAALEKLAKGSHVEAARRAQEALPSTAPPGQIGNRIFIAGGGIQVAVAGAAFGAGRRVSVRHANGVKTIEGSEGEEKVKIVEEANKSIKMEVTTKKNGKEVTDKYEAKDTDDLKKKDAKAYEIYQKYAQNALGAAGGIGFAPVARRINSLETAARLLNAYSNTLERYTNDDAIKEGSKEAKENLKKSVVEMREKLGKLEKRLQESLDKAEKKK